MWKQTKTQLKQNADKLQEIKNLSLVRDSIRKLLLKEKTEKVKQDLFDCLQQVDTELTEALQSFTLFNQKYYG